MPHNEHRREILSGVFIFALILIGVFASLGAVGASMNMSTDENAPIASAGFAFVAAYTFTQLANLFQRRDPGDN